MLKLPLSGGEPRSGGGGVAPSYSVHRETCFRAAMSEASETPDFDGVQAWRLARRTRYQRRQISSGWLIGQAREAAGRERDSTATAGDSDWVRPPRLARCRWRAAAEVSVHGDAGGAHYGGVEQCGSIWGCPVCASVIRAGRAADIALGVDSWQAAGNGLVLVTVTLRHVRKDALGDTLDAMLVGWRKLMQGRAWLDFAAREGVVGQVRACECTYGRSGWHPHIHALFFVGGSVDKSRAVIWQQELAGRWASIVKRLGYATGARAVDVQAVDESGEVVGRYLSKLQEDVHGRQTSVAKEISRADYKRGRGGSIMPFDLLDTTPGTIRVGIKRRRLLWLEYVEATKGRQCITWSPKLVAWFEKTHGRKPNDDKKILQTQDVREFRFLVPGDQWDQRRNSPDVLTSALEHLEAERVDTAMAVLGGYVPETVDPSTGVELGPWHGERRFETEALTTIDSPVERGQLRVWDEGSNEQIGRRVFPCRSCLRVVPVSELVRGVCGSDECVPAAAAVVRRCLSCGGCLDGRPLVMVRCGGSECTTESASVRSARGLDIATMIARAGRPARSIVPGVAGEVT